MQKIPVYVISLASALERRALIGAHLERLGVEYSIVDGVAGSAMTEAARTEINPDGNMSPGVLGCYLSHVRVYERIVADQSPVALVLEDDTVLEPEVVGLLQSGCSNLDFDYCFLGCDDRGDEGFVFYDSRSGIDLGGGLSAFVLSSGPFCLNAYLVTGSGAKKRLEYAMPARTAIDHYHYLPYRPRFRAIIPLVASLNEQHAISSLSSGTWTFDQKKLHRQWWYFPLRDAVKLRHLRKECVRRVTNFPYDSQWRTFASGMKILRNRGRQRPK